jgi:methyl-accepting chemotaxis protein
MSESQETILTIFAAVVTMAMLAQGITTVLVYLSVRNISRRFDELSEEIRERAAALEGKADQIFAAAQEALGEVNSVAEATRQVRENLTSTADLVHKRAVALDGIVERRVADVDSFLQETTEFARGQLSRMENVIDRSAERIDETFDIVHKGILTPLNELNAIVMGLKVGLDVLLRRRRPSTKIHQDEEMFI